MSHLNGQGYIRGTSWPLVSVLRPKGQRLPIAFSWSRLARSWYIYISYASDGQLSSVGNQDEKRKWVARSADKQVVSGRRFGSAATIRGLR